MKLKFIKLATRWFVHLPDYDGPVDDLEMVCGADSMCYELDTENTGVVDLEVSDNSDFDWDYCLEFSFSTTNEIGEVDGSFYIVTNKHFETSYNIWLCNVTKYIFKKFPPFIYIKSIK